MIECSGISATWCHVHGDCPLHSERSTHGEMEVVATVYGTFVLGGEGFASLHLHAPAPASAGRTGVSHW